MHFHSRNSIENVVCEMTAILYWPQCVNPRDFLGPLRPGSVEIISLCIRMESFSPETIYIPQEYYV